MSPRRTALIDADLLVYRFAFKNQKDFNWGDVTSSTADERAACEGIDAFLEECLDAVKAEDYIVALSCPSDQNFRLSFLPSYKRNRAESSRPLLYEPLRKHIEENHKTYERPHLEADDVLGILATMPSASTSRRKVLPIIVTLDKDLLTIPARIYMPPMEWVGRKEQRHIVTQAQADWYHLHQTLMGDTVDHYKGCPGIGEKGTAKVIGEMPTEKEGFDVATAWTRVVAAYKKKGLTEQDALVQARVARILRASDYHFERRKAKLWNPPRPQ